MPKLKQDSGIHFLIRRTHLYLALALVPWFLMYGITAAPFAHPQWFQALRDMSKQEWTERMRRSFSEPVPDDRGELRRFGRRMLEESGISRASMGITKVNENRVNIYSHDFWSSTRLTYFVDRQELVAEDRWFQWNEFLTGLHARGGWEQEHPLAKAWAFAVDIVSISMVLWVCTGLIMWWRIRRTRIGGFVALLAGAVSFVLFTISL